MLQAVLQAKEKWCQMVTSQEGMKGIENAKYLDRYIDGRFSPNL